MDRKGINSGKCSAICAIKEKLDALWNRTHNAFTKLNGTEGDGTGNLQIEAGTGISLEQSGNRILINTEEQLPYTGISPIQIDPDSREVSLLMDDTPTANSGRAVKSGGVFAAVDTVDNRITDIVTGSQTVGRAALADTADALNGILPINNGGTGSSVKNFVDLTTNQTISGIKTIRNANPVISRNDSIAPHIYLRRETLDATNTTQSGDLGTIPFIDKNDVRLVALYTYQLTNGRGQLILRVRNSNGTTKAIVLGTGDII